MQNINIVIFGVSGLLFLGTLGVILTGCGKAGNSLGDRNEFIPLDGDSSAYNWTIEELQSESMYYRYCSLHVGMNRQ